MVFMLQKKRKTKNKKRKEMNKGPATFLEQCAKQPDLAGWYTGENSGGVLPRPLFVELAAGGFTRARGPCAERVPSSACVLLVHTPHGRRQLAPPGARGAGGAFGHVHSF